MPDQQQVDYDALAAQHGGAVSVDYDAIAAQHGGSVPPPAPTKPQTWVDRYPNVAGIARGAVNTLPVLGAAVGGALATPETLGTGTIAGAALGAGVGRGARDLVAEYTGLEPKSSPLAKAGTIAVDTAVTAAVPGMIEAIKTPVQTVAEFADIYRKLLPRWAQPQFLQDLPATIAKMRGGPQASGPILERPAWQTWPPPIREKMAFTAKDVVHIKDLMSKGASQDEAVKAVFDLKGK